MPLSHFFKVINLTETTKVSINNLINIIKLQKLLYYAFKWDSHPLESYFTSSNVAK